MVEEMEGTRFGAADPLIHISDLDLQFPLSQVYENIDFDEPTDRIPDLTESEI